MAIEYLATRTKRFNGLVLKFALRDDGEQISGLQQREQSSGLQEKSRQRELMQHTEMQPLGLQKQATDEPFETTAVAAFNMEALTVGPLLD